MGKKPGLIPEQTRLAHMLLVQKHPIAAERVYVCVAMRVRVQDQSTRHLNKYWPRIHGVHCYIVTTKQAWKQASKQARRRVRARKAVFSLPAPRRDRLHAPV